MPLIRDLDTRVTLTTDPLRITYPEIDNINFFLQGLGIDTNKEEKLKVPMPKKYIINHGATVLIWDHGEKTVVKRCKDDEFNKRLGFLTAFFQHYCRNE